MAKVFPFIVLAVAVLTYLAPRAVFLLTTAITAVVLILREWSRPQKPLSNSTVKPSITSRYHEEKVPLVSSHGLIPPPRSPATSTTLSSVAACLDSRARRCCRAVATVLLCWSSTTALVGARTCMTFKDSISMLACTTLFHGLARCSVWLQELLRQRLSSRKWEKRYHIRDVCCA